MTNEQKLANALFDFRKTYPSITSADLQTFIISWREAQKDIKQNCIDFSEWCMNNKYTYYFNGEKYMWVNSKKQEYYTTEELYEKFNG